MAEEPGPRALIENYGQTRFRLAMAAGVSLATIENARSRDRWPSQAQARNSLRRALGVDPRPVFPLTINSVEECEAVLAAFKPRESLVGAHGGDSAAPAVAGVQP